MEESIIKLNDVSKDYRIRITDSAGLFQRMVKKKYKDIHALSKVSIDILEGEYVGLIGNNGAGKSTLVKLMSGILLPTSGTIHVLGKDPFRFRITNNKNIGVVFGQRSQLKWDLSPLDSFLLLKVIYDIPDDIYKKNIQKLEEIFELEEIKNNPIRTLSLGQRMRCEVAAAFLHNPKIVFLDEPTIGLDVFSKEAILHFLQEMKKTTQTTVILTTHDLEEIHNICDKAIIMNEGKVILEDNIENLMMLYNREKNIIVTTQNANPKFDIENPQIEFIQESHKLVVQNIKQEDIPNVLSQIATVNDIVDVSIKEKSFTDIVKDYLSDYRQDNQYE